MKTLIVILILLSFLQVSLVPLNLVLIVLILRAYLNPERANLYLGFFFGMLISFLGSQPLGIYSLMYISFIQAVHMLRKAPLSIHYFVMIPAVILILALNSIILGVFMRASIQLWPGILAEVLVAIPIYFILKIWEERFSVKPEVKLRV